MVMNRVGPPVRGNDLFGRDSFVDLLWRKIEAGSVLLSAPRRFGKTSVMYRLIDQPRGNYKIVHADLEHLSDPADLILELIVKLTADTRLASDHRGDRQLHHRTPESPAWCSRRGRSVRCKTETQGTDRSSVAGKRQTAAQASGDLRSASAVHPGRVPYDD